MTGSLFSLLIWAQPALAGDLVVTLLDVGQGDAVLLETPGGATVLVDAGLAKARVSHQLRQLGVEHLDLVVASHPHADHIGGMAEVLTTWTPDLFWYSGMDHTTQAWAKVKAALQTDDIETVAVQLGDTLELDDVRIEVLWPADTLLRNTRSDLNANSVVLRVEHGQDCLLLTGDAEEVTERQLLRRGLEQCDVLKVAHHGSRHSNTESWFDAVQPEIALISVGRDNRYHHPGEETMTRLVGCEAAIFRTDLTGVIQLVSSGDGWTVRDGLPWDAPVDPALVVVPPLPPEPVADADPVQADTATTPVSPVARKGWLRRLLDRRRARRATRQL